MSKICRLGWYPMHEKAHIPYKKDAAAGYDIYTVEENVRIEPHCQHLFATGLGCIVGEGYWLMAFDRGSTGSRGLHVHCGVIDNDYRGEIFICIKNDNDYPAVFGKFDKVEMVNGELHYPLSKGIAQLIPVRQPICSSCVVGKDEGENSLKTSERKDGKLGSSGK